MNEINGRNEWTRKARSFHPPGLTPSRWRIESRVIRILVLSHGEKAQLGEWTVDGTESNSSRDCHTLISICEHSPAFDYRPGQGSMRRKAVSGIQ